MVKENVRTEKSPIQCHLDEAGIKGRDWFPRGLYTLSGRGSTPLRSSYLSVFMLLHYWRFVNEYFKG